MLDVNNTLGWQSKTPQRSQLRLQTSATPSIDNIYTRTWTTLVQLIGQDIEYKKDAGYGDTIRVVTPGVYSITYGDTSTSAGANFALVTNVTGSGGPSGEAKETLAVGYVAAANAPVQVIWTGYLEARTRIVPNNNHANVGSNAFAQILSICKVSD